MRMAEKKDDDTPVNSSKTTDDLPFKCEALASVFKNIPFFLHTHARFAKFLENFLHRIFFGRICYFYFYAYQLRIFYAKKIENRIFYFYTFHPLSELLPVRVPCQAPTTGRRPAREGPRGLAVVPAPRLVSRIHA